MGNNIFSPMEIDAIGEIMNISLGSSATAVSTMLDHRVDITTPRVTVIEAKDLVLGNLDPAVGVEIKYISGLEGSNIMLLKRGDVKTIVDILMGSETPDEEFELNDLTISAVCEVMNQMMGAASTALSDFLGKLVNISTPQSFELDNFEQFKEEHFPATAGHLVVVRFILSIEGFLRSEFINVISVSLARELIAGFGLESSEFDDTEEVAESATLSQAEIERLMAGAAAVAPEPPAPAPQPAAHGGGAKLSQEEVERLIQAASAGSAPTPTPPPAPAPAPPPPPAPPQAAPAAPSPAPPYPGYPQSPAYPPPMDAAMQAYYPPPGYYYPTQPPQPPEPKVINTQPMKLPSLDPDKQLSKEQASNLELIMSVPLEISVEIGRTTRKVQEILAFSKGSLVVLDKLAGDQVDLFVNGHCIAKGDVVVIDDSFGIRITEIIPPPSPSELMNSR
jgi:flagellar motor switch protein FliN/FliY